MPSTVGRLAARHAIVTGGASGIGFETVLRFLAEGATVSILDRSEESLRLAGERLVDSGSDVQLVQCDVASEESVRNAVSRVSEEFGKIDVLVNSAGIAEKAAAIETTLESWNRVLSINLTGTFLMCREVGALMAEAGGGSIVNIASIDAHAADRDELSYNSSKAGVLGVTRTFAVELGRVGVRVNSVSPGYVLTEMTLASVAADPRVQKVLDGRFDRVPLGRGIRPSEIASICAFLASDDASAVTGQDLIADAGLLADAYLVAALREAAEKV